MTTSRSGPSLVFYVATKRAADPCGRQLTARRAADPRRISARQKDWAACGGSAAGISLTCHDPRLARCCHLASAVRSPFPELREAQRSFLRVRRASVTGEGGGQSRRPRRYISPFLGRSTDELRARNPDDLANACVGQSLVSLQKPQRVSLALHLAEPGKERFNQARKLERPFGLGAAPLAFISAAPSLVARIVRGIDVQETSGADAVQLDDRFALRPRVVIGPVRD